MGAVCGKSQVGVLKDQKKSAIEVITSDIERDHEITSGIDEKIIQILQSKKKERDLAGETSKNFNKFILQFNSIEKSFLSIKKTYDDFASADTGGIQYSELKSMLNILGAEMTDKDMEEIFHESDMRRDHSLDFDEFLISLAIAYLLGLVEGCNNAQTELAALEKVVEKEIEEDGESIDETNVPDMMARTSQSAEDKRMQITRLASTRLPEFTQNQLHLAKSFDTILESYMLFDEDASGTINFDELESVMSEKNGSSAPGFLNIERWKELDWDNDGTITFQEYFLAFCKWVGIEEE